ncbi:uncharacterized protein LOC133313325 [Gastrolobium bilobum]|uniref:uncharacterized protein LOC133313325 n=1 Tax=Gastrolobium bilobum TaxID=150636 RepID=UPI002AB1ADE4|nr:uncharacterized protein LOC133313325 [Gastrolobium bilobum]
MLGGDSAQLCLCFCRGGDQRFGIESQSSEFEAKFLPFTHSMGTRGVIGDKWSMRILWACAIGSAIGLYMVAVQRQAQNRDKMLAEGLKAMESGESYEEDV